MWKCFCLITIAAMFRLYISVAVEYLVQPNDRILFVGSSNTLTGEVSNYGFINLLKQLTAGLLNNVTFNGIGRRATTYDEMLINLRNNYLAYYQPTKVVLMLEIMHEDHDMSESRFKVEKLMALLLNSKIPTVLCPLDVSGVSVGETVDDRQSQYAEDFVWVLGQQVARDYGAMFVDLHTPLLKHWEGVTVEGLPHSTLSFGDGMLNEAGHALVAHILVQRLLLGGVTSGGHDFLETNEAVAARRDAADVRVGRQYHAEREAELQRDVLLPGDESRSGLSADEL